MLPAAFYDIDSNVELLERCRPLSVKLVDCNKFPCYIEKRINSKKYSHHNSKSSLQELDCMELSSSDENDIYDTIIVRRVSNDIADINEEFNRSRFITDNSISENKLRNIQTKHKISSWQNNNTPLIDNNGNYSRVLEKNSSDNFDINSNITHRVSDNICQTKKQNKSNKRSAVEGDYIQGNKEMDFKVTKKNRKIDSKSCKRRKNSQSFTPYYLEETYIDKIDTYARLVDKAFTNLQTKKPIACNKNIESNDTVKYSEDRIELKPKSHITNKPKTVKLKDDNDNIKKYINSSMTVKKDTSAIARDLKYMEDGLKEAINKSLINNFKQVLRSKLENDPVKRFYRNREKETKCTIDEISQNNGSCSPILPCPLHINKSNNPNTKNIASDAPLSSFVKCTIDKEYNIGVCANQFYSANRVIPHYHNETIQKTKTVKSPIVYQNTSKKSTVTLENMQRHNQNVVCDGNDYFKNKSKLKQNIGGNFGDFSDIANKNDKKQAVNQLNPTNSDIPNMHTNNGIPYYNCNQELDNMFKESLARGVSIPYDLLISSEVNNNSKYDSSEINKMSVIPGQKPQYPYCNDTTPTFPFQSIISNRDNFQSNDFSVNANRCNALPYTQSLLHYGNSLLKNNNNNSNPNYLGNKICNYKLTQPQMGNGQTLNTPYIINHYIKNVESDLHINYGNRYTPKFPERLPAIKNLYQDQNKITSTLNDKYSTLKQHLDQVPLKVYSKSNQRMDKKIINNTQLNQQNRKATVTNKNIILISDSNFNTDKEKVITALVATDYVRQKAIRKEENNNRTIGGRIISCEGKYKYITQLLNQPPHGVNKPDIENTANGSLGQSTDSHMYNLMNSNYSQTQYRDNKNLLSH